MKKRRQYYDIPPLQDQLEVNRGTQRDAKALSAGGFFDTL